MKNQKTILNRLLNKYENSKHLLDPGTSLRRVMLKVEKKTSLDKGTQRKTTENELPSLTQCTA